MLNFSEGAGGEPGRCMASMLVYTFIKLHVTTDVHQIKWFAEMLSCVCIIGHTMH